MLFYGKTDVGNHRAANQDNFLIKKYSADALLAVVCDGMGGVNGGNTASSVAAETFYSAVNEAESKHPSFFGMSDDDIYDVLRSAAAKANRAVYDMSAANPSLAGMGTTLVGCIISGERAYVVNVGDSRLYFVEDRNINQVTRDHSYVQYLVDMGKITPDEAKHSRNKNLITRAVGTEKSVECDLFMHGVKNGSTLVLCSDGLTNHVDPFEICDTVSKVNNSGDVQTACESLIDQANQRGGLDNITVVVLSI